MHIGHRVQAGDNRDVERDRACGAPQHAAGARWFPDTITVTVPFSRPA